MPGRGAQLGQQRRVQAVQGDLDGDAAEVQHGVVEDGLADRAQRLEARDGQRRPCQHEHLHLKDLLG
jgi:hypothetical protein